MHRRQQTFPVNAPPEDLWAFIRDFESFCACIPGVERINKLDDRSVELTVREKIGVVPLIVDLTGRIVAEDPPHGMQAVATADHLTIDIDVAVRGTATGTEITAAFEVAGKGPLKPVVDRLFESRATERAAQFAELLEQRFGATLESGEPADPVPTPDPAPAQSMGIGDWLRRLWRRLFG